jgi:B9 domain-containing protein 1
LDIYADSWLVFVASLSMAESDRNFQLIVHGTVESAECLSAGSMYCRSTVVIGRDWSYVVQGGERANTVDVVTQLAERKPGPQALFTWNTPFEFVLESPTPAGWPQIAFAATSIRADGKDTVVGYARCHVPRKPGSYSRWASPRSRTPRSSAHPMTTCS